MYISWFGGEPLLGLKKIYSISQRLKLLADEYKVDYQAGATTNGYLLNRFVFPKLLTCDVRFYQITIDGEKEAHDFQRKLKNGSGSFDRIIENLKNMQNTDEKFSVSIRFNVSKNNYNSVKQFLNETGKFFIQDKRFSFFFKSVGDWGLGERKTNVLTQSKGTTETDLTVLGTQLGYSIGNISAVLSNDSICYGRKPNSFAIDVNGQILKCTTKLIYDEKNKVGNIIDGTVDNNKLKYWVDEYDYEEKCLQCKYFPLCRGGACPIDIIDNHNRVCQRKRKHIEEYMDILKYSNSFDLELKCTDN